MCGSDGPARILPLAANELVWPRTSAPPIVCACLDVAHDHEDALPFVTASFTELLEHLQA